MVKGAGASLRATEGLFASFVILPIAAIAAVTIFSHPTYAVDNSNTANTTSSLGLSITPTNLTITVPATGGLTTGKQTVTINANSLPANGVNYNLSLSSKDTNTSLLPTKTGNTAKLTSTTGAATKPAIELNNNEWGISLDGNSSMPPSYIGLPSSNATPLELMNGTLNTTANTATKDITFATKTTESTPADTYSINIVYTLTAEEILPTPTIDRTTPAAYQYGDNTNTTWQTTVGGAPTSFNSKTITIQGGNFIQDSTNVYIDINNNGKADSNEKCTNVTVATDGNSLTCNIPTEEDPDNPNANTNTNPILTGNATNRTDAVYNIIVANGDANTTNSKVTKNNAFAYYASSICENANPASSCQVDIDSNMIPVKYTGNTDKPEWQIAGITKQGDWYNYENKQWANAVTMNQTNLAKYKNSPAGTVIPEDAILSYFTYIPRYAYEVMRPNAVDKYVTDQDFAIKFEKATTTKKTPIATCNILNPTKAQMWKDGNANNVYSNILAKDYRQDCNSANNTARLYGNATGTTWVTHPAFTWQYTKAINGFDKTTELNGIWVGKHETSGSTAQPTIKPNQPSMTNDKYASLTVGYAMDVAKSFGVKDSNNMGTVGTTVVQNNNNLSTYYGHAIKAGEWGAIAYLSASKYGAGVNGVKTNTAKDTVNDGNGNQSQWTTGCGPNAGDDVSTYPCIDSLDHQYQSTIGQLASTTNNPTGIYDMAGGQWDKVMLFSTTEPNVTNQPNYLTVQATSPYIETVNRDSAPEWSSDKNTWSSGVFTYNVCMYGSCGGRTLHEVYVAQSGATNINGWGNDYHWLPNSAFACGQFGGGSTDKSNSGVFSTGQGYCVSNAIRVVLSAY